MLIALGPPKWIVRSSAIEWRRAIPRQAVEQADKLAANNEEVSGNLCGRADQVRGSMGSGRERFDRGPEDESPPVSFIFRRLLSL
jgi:hypothetical protein